MKADKELTDQELNQLKEAKTEDEWNEIVDEIKDHRGGQYPPDWWIKVLSDKSQFQVDLSINIRNNNR